MAGIELGTPYYIYNSDGTDYVALNDPADPNFVGYVTDITGLDDSGVRENAQVVVAGDGGHHGPFWKDRRPWTMSGIIWPTLPVLARDTAQQHLVQILNSALKDDGAMYWTPADGNQRYIAFRKQQPVRITKGQSNVEKTFQISCVSADPLIYSNKTKSKSTYGGTPGIFDGRWASGTINCINNGDQPAPALFNVTGPMDGVSVVNNSTGKNFTVDVLLQAGDVLGIDLRGQYPTVVTLSGFDLYGQIDLSFTDWDIAIDPGFNIMQVVELAAPGVVFGSVANGNTGIEIEWSDAWG
jgi:hypothetical protein